jgi:hypothetical protein
MSSITARQSSTVASDRVSMKTKSIVHCAMTNRHDVADS